MYEDHDILVVNKASGLLTVSNEKIKEKTAYYLLSEYVKKGNYKSRNRIFIVHRLGKDTSGIIVFAKNSAAKRYLQEIWPRCTRKYAAVIHGVLPDQEGVFSSYLAENSIHTMYSVDDPAKGKLAQTGYKVLQTSKSYSLLEINLLTERKNQIRVHCAEHGCPIVGDAVYGKKEKGIRRIALHATSLTLKHPHTHESMTFETPIPAWFTTLIAP